MIHHSYHFLRNTLLLLLSLLILSIFVVSHPRTLPYLADRFLKVDGLSYGRMEGSLLTGITLYDVNYLEAVFIKRAHVGYKVPALLFSPPTIDIVSADHVDIILDRLPASSDEESELSIPPFSIDTLSLKQLTLIMDENIIIDLDAKKVTVDQALDIEALTLLLGTDYAKVTLEGRIDHNRLSSQSTMTPTSNVVELIDPIVQGVPPTLDIDLIATVDDVNISTRFEKLILSADENLSVQQMHVKLDYHITDEYLTFETEHTLTYADHESRLKEDGVVTLTGAYASNIDGEIILTSVPLPFETFHAEAAGDKESLVLRVDAGPLVLSAQSEDLAQFRLHIVSEALKLAFYPDLPDLFEGNTIALEANATLQTAPFSLKGKLLTEGVNVDVTGRFDVDDHSMLYKASVHPKEKAPLFEEYPVELFSPMNIVFYSELSNETLNVDANALNMTLFKNENNIQGWGNLATTTFKTKGSIEDNGDLDLIFSSSTPSLYALASTFKDPQLGKYEFYDAQLDINTTLSLSDTLQIKSQVRLPWYVAQLDSQTYHSGEDLFFETTFKDERLRIDRYHLDIMGHDLYADRPSYLSIDENGTIDLESFWIYDTLLLTGTFEPSSQQGSFKLAGERFHYEGPEGNITAKVDITAEIDGERSQDIEGAIVILDGLITASPNNDYAITDDDIIIIQDVKPPSTTQRSINIAISSEAPLTYLHDNIMVKLTPDFTLYQDPLGPLQLLGMVHIDAGEITAGDKFFDLQESDIYLQGESPINPYLNLHLQYTTLDRIDIEIFVANTLDSPVIVFTSSPPMSQDDILSYLLFGGPATSTFESSGDPTTTASVGAMLLGTGLKTIFSDTTGIKVDTLNILTDKEGKLGYEVGARLNRDIRLVYKNDTISSIILQYSINRSIRIDVDVRETGQGINLLYIKDF